MKNVIKPLSKSVLIPLGFTAAASSADAGVNKQILVSGHHSSSSVLRPPLRNALHNATLIISNDETEDIIKIVKSLEDSGLLLNRVSQKFQNEAKEQKGWFLSMLLDTLGTSLLGNILACKGAIAKNVSEKRKSKRQGRGINKAG